jgi:hypothetical protein
MRQESSQVILILALCDIPSRHLHEFSYKSSTSPSLVSKSSSVTYAASQIFLSSLAPSTSSVSSSSRDSFTTILARLTASCLVRLSSSSCRERLTRAVYFIDMLVDKAVKNDLSLNTRVIRSVFSVDNLINDIYKERNSPRVRELSRDI